VSVRSFLAPQVPSVDPVADRARLGLRWWREFLYIAVFYAVYSGIRNQFGSAAVSPEHALEHARQVVRIERALHLFVEPRLQAWFITSNNGTVHYELPGARMFLEFWNVFYGTFHFVVTAIALLWMFRRFPTDYARWRNTLAFTTGLALIGFAFYPLMPPRLLTGPPPYGAGLHEFTFVDTLAKVGGLWSFDSGTMQKVSNQYAAMPSLHFAWSSWCLLVLYPKLKRRWAKVLITIYPLCTLWAIMVTANHYWLDAAGGVVILTVGYLLGSQLAAFNDRRRAGRLAAAVAAAPTAVGAHEEGDGDGGYMVAAPTSGYGADASRGPAYDTDLRPSPHVPRDDQQPS
jgi:hypothetical protein